MPIYMDLHNVPGITAIDAAKAHQQDLIIQNQYECTCMTYWVDESKGSAFCLIEAPNKDAVRELHDEAHGLIPHQIIEVNTTIVESFLGRIYDPDFPTTLEENLKVFNDPAFRVLVLIQTTDAIVLSHQIGEKACGELFQKYQDALTRQPQEFEGKMAEHQESVAILSFTSAFQAVSFAINFHESFTEKERNTCGLKISINAGMPVTKNENMFGEAIELGKHLFYSKKAHKVVTASIIKEITHKNYFDQNRFNIATYSASEEQQLNKIFDVLNRYGNNESFGINDFCNYMHLSKSSLNRVAKSLTGRSPNNLLIEYRLQKALQKLKSTPDDIGQIAFDVGFSSPAYFSNCFKKFFEVSPSAYQKQVAQNS